MLKEFNLFNSTGIIIPVEFKNHPNIFKNISDDVFVEFNNGSHKGISWIYNNRKIIIKNTNSSIAGFPSIDLKYVVAVYTGMGGDFSPPKNAIIFNLDGSVHKVLEIPKLISKTMIERIRINEAFNPPLMSSNFEGGLQFSGFGWKRNQIGELVNSITIIYDNEWWESRVLNIESGEIVECLGSGRL